MRKQMFITLAALLFIACHVWLLNITFHYPLNSTIMTKDSNNHWIVKSFDAVSPKFKPNLLIGDIIIQVDGIPTNDFISIKKWHTLERASVLTVERDGHSFKIPVGSNKFTEYDLIPFLGGTISYFMAGILYLKMRHSLSAKYLAYLFLDMGIAFSALGASSRGDALGKVLVFSGMILAPIIFLHFISVLAYEKDGIKSPRRLLHCLYGFFLVCLIAQLPFFLTGDWNYPIYYYLRIISMVFFIFGFLLDFGIMTYHHFKHKKMKTYLSTVIKTAWISLFISISPLLFLYFIPYLTLGVIWVDSYYLAWAILFFPLSIARLIVSKRLYDIGTILRRALITILFSLLPSGVLVLTLLPFVPPMYLGLYFIVFVIIFSFCLYMMENVFTRLESVLFPRKHYLQTSIKQIAHKLETISSFRDLKDVILADIVGILEVYGSAIVFVYKETTEIITAGEIDIAEAERLVHAEEKEHPEYACFPINRNETYASYLIVTQKRTNLMLVLEEKQWLSAIISYLAVCLENIHLVRKLTVKLEEFAAHVPNEEEAGDLNWFRKVTFELQEAERKRIATDLHDTTMQDIFFLKSKLALIFNGLPVDEITKRKIDSVYEYMEVINTNLRQSFFELFPHLLQEIGLIRTIEKVIEKEAIGCPFEIEFYNDGAERVERFDLETKRHLFRIVQELLNNAKKHSQATKVTFQLSDTNGAFELRYQDDGVGFVPKRAASQEIASSGRGLEQMRSRVFFLQGYIQVETGQGRGLQVSITIPMKEGLTA